MSRGLIAGGTDYSHQPLDDIFEDLRQEAKYIFESIKSIKEYLQQVQGVDYWNKEVPSNFKSCVDYSMKHFDTSYKEIESILKEMETSIQEHHCRRLLKIGEVSYKINH